MEIIDFLKAILFGIVEGITEWLPISSTGHMILLNQIWPLEVGETPEDFYSMFEVVIQLGAIMAVVVLFWKEIWPFGKKENHAPLRFSHSSIIYKRFGWINRAGKWMKTDIFKLWFRILVL